MCAPRIERLDPRLDALIPSGTTIEVVIDGRHWTEGPVWDVPAGALLFSDVPGDAIFRWAPGGPPAIFLAPSGYTGVAPFVGREPGSNGLAFDRQGRLVMCQHGNRRIARRKRDGSTSVLADRYDGKRLNSPNDLVFRSNGDLYFSDPPFGLAQTFADPERELDFQGVFRMTESGDLSTVVRDLDAPNGVALSPDERTLYVSNASKRKPIWMAYEVRADGALGAARQFAEAHAWVRDGDGVPDGLKIDRRGNVFAAGPGGIHVFAPDGTRLGRSPGSRLRQLPRLVISDF